MSEISAAVEKAKYARYRQRFAVPAFAYRSNLVCRSAAPSDLEHIQSYVPWYGSMSCAGTPHAHAHAHSHAHAHAHHTEVVANLSRTSRSDDAGTHYKHDRDLLSQLSVHYV
jgi:hypothetical protein